MPKWGVRMSLLSMKTMREKRMSTFWFMAEHLKFQLYNLNSQFAPGAASAFWLQCSIFQQYVYSGNGFLASHPGCGFSRKMDNHVGWARRPRKVSKLPTKRDPQNVMIASHHCFIGWSSKFARPERSSRSYRFVQKAKLSFLFCPWWLHRSLQLIGCVLFSPKSQLMAAHFPLLQCVPIAHGTLPLSCHSFFCSIQASVSTWHLKRPWCGPLRSVVSFWLWKDSRM